jgi:hypothetical protein
LSLIGPATASGEFKRANKKVLDFFLDAKGIANPDERKADLETTTIETHPDRPTIDSIDIRKASVLL